MYSNVFRLNRAELAKSPIRTRAHQPGCECVPQIVETDVSDSCQLDGPPEGSFDVSELLTVFPMTGKNKLSLPIPLQFGKEAEDRVVYWNVLECAARHTLSSRSGYE